MFGEFLALLPGSHTAFHRLQYRNARRTWYLFSCQHDVLNKWKKLQNEKAKLAYWQTNSMSNAWCTWQSLPTS